jgi:tetratricopeptide (TPR) repeat protein
MASRTKKVDYIDVKLTSNSDKGKSDCFIIYSTKEEHIDVVIDCIEMALGDLFRVRKLPDILKSGDSQYGELQQILKKCALAIVILDGFRPNVLFEYGVIQGLLKPCIVLLEINAKVDVVNYFDSQKTKKIDNPEIDIDKHFSDVKDRVYVKYNKNKPKETRETIKKEYEKLKAEINCEISKGFIAKKDDLTIVQMDTLVNDMEIILDLYSREDGRINSGDLEKLEEVLNKIKDQKVKLKPMYYFYAAIVYSKLKQHDKAIGILNLATSKPEKDIDTLILQSEIHLDGGNLQSALAVINKALRLENKEYLWHQKAIILERLGKLQEASFCYEKGISLKHKCSSIHYQYGVLLYEMGQFTPSLDQLNIAIKMRQSDESYHIFKSLILEKMQRYDEAIQAAKDAICFNELNADAWFRLGKVTKDSEKAIEYFDRAISINPEHEESLCSKAAELSNKGNYDEALSIWGTLKCEKREKCSILLRNIVVTEYFMSPSEVKSDLNKLNYWLQLIDTSIQYADTEELPDIMNNKGFLLTMAGRPEEAISILKSSITTQKLAIDRILPSYNLAIAYLCINQISSAVVELEACKAALEQNIGVPPNCKGALVPFVENGKITLEIDKEDHLLIDLVSNAFTVTSTVMNN